MGSFKVGEGQLVGRLRVNETRSSKLQFVGIGMEKVRWWLAGAVVAWSGIRSE